jgi:hypothetical protein
MNQPRYQLGVIRSTYTATVAAPVTAELFPEDVQAVFDRLESLAQNDVMYEAGEVRPSKENIQWAKKVLLRVLPRHYLAGADIDAFHGEIHVNWERDNKRVVAFLPGPNELKIYCERVKDNGEVEHELSKAGDDPWEITGRLKWLFQN